MFSYSESYIEGDATPSNTSVSSGVVTSLPMLGNTTTTSGGVAGSLAGTISSDGAMTITAGGAGTTATGQVVLSLKLTDALASAAVVIRSSRRQHRLIPNLRRARCRPTQKQPARSLKRLSARTIQQVLNTVLAV